MVVLQTFAINTKKSEERERLTWLKDLLQETKLQETQNNKNKITNIIPQNFSKEGTKKKNACESRSDEALQVSHGPGQDHHSDPDIQKHVGGFREDDDMTFRNVTPNPQYVT